MMNKVLQLEPKKYQCKKIADEDIRRCVMAYKFSAILEKEGELYTALCPEVDITSQGKTVEEALNNLKEAVELF